MYMVNVSSKLADPDCTRIGSDPDPGFLEVCIRVLKIRIRFLKVISGSVFERLDPDRFLKVVSGSVL